MSKPNNCRKRMLPSSFTSLVSNNDGYIYSHSNDSVDSNLLLVLHGMGDRAAPLHKFAERMELPQTAVLSLDASVKLNGRDGFMKLPFDLGHTWFLEHDLSVEAIMKSFGASGMADDNGSFPALTYLNGSDVDRKKSLKRAVKNFHLILEELFKVWTAGEIFIFGYSCGACFAADMALFRAKNRLDPLGGIVCVAGGFRGGNNSFKDEAKDGRTACRFTPILIVCGSKDASFSVENARTAEKMYDLLMQGKRDDCEVKLVIVRGKKHGMIQSRDEMEPVMEFFSKHLRRRMIGLEDQGWIEVIKKVD